MPRSVRLLIFVGALLIFQIPYPAFSSSCSETTECYSHIDESVSSDMAYVYATQLALARGDHFEAVKLGYKWMGKDNASWQPFDFIGDVYFCLRQNHAARLNYLLAKDRAEQAGQTIAVLDLKISALEGDGSAQRKLSELFKCPEKLGSE